MSEIETWIAKSEEHACDLPVNSATRFALKGLAKALRLLAAKVEALERQGNRYAALLEAEAERLRAALENQPTTSAAPGSGRFAPAPTEQRLPEPGSGTAARMQPLEEIIGHVKELIRAISGKPLDSNWRNDFDIQARGILGLLQRLPQPIAAAPPQPEPVAATEAGDPTPGEWSVIKVAIASLSRLTRSRLARELDTEAAAELERLRDLTRWHDSEKEKPPMNKTVIVDGGVAIWTGEHWEDMTGRDWGRHIAWEVTHWLPLPLVPKEEK